MSAEGSKSSHEFLVCGCASKFFDDRINRIGGANLTTFPIIRHSPCRQLWISGGPAGTRRYCNGVMDTRTPEQRSYIMRSVGTRHTGPEMLVRKVSHSMGLRFRLHRKALPGTPDLVFPKYRVVIFVNGCFWHGHGCSKGRLPKSRLDFWVPKIQHNRDRDAESVKRLRSEGWRVLTIWQCETKDLERVRTRLTTFFRSSRHKRSRSARRPNGRLRNKR